MQDTQAVIQTAPVGGSRASFRLVSDWIACFALLTKPSIVLILLNNPALFTNDTLSGPIPGKVLVRPSIYIAARGWIQLFVSILNSRNQIILINPSEITACAAKVVIVIDEVKLLNSNINVTKITPYVKVTL